MSTIFVAYGNRDRRYEVLEFAARQATAGDYGLLVYHILERPNESMEQVTEEIESVVDRVDPYLVYDIEIERVGRHDDRRRQDRLIRAITDTDRDVEYVVMGEVERGPLEQFTHSSMTEAVLRERSHPVALVPI